MKNCISPRHQPFAETEFLRFQYGTFLMRPERYPVYSGNRITGYKLSEDLVPVFHLLGFGANETDAFKMACNHENQTR